MSLISSISGVLFSKSPSEAILDVGGIRFLLHISFATYEILPDKGNSVDILTHLHVKEDILDLYGFSPIVCTSTPNTMSLIVELPTNTAS